MTDRFPLPNDDDGVAPVPAGAAVVVLVSSSWAGPSRPAPTVLRELSRRWGDAVRTMLIDDPAGDVLDALRIEHLPTWLRFLPAPPAGHADPQEEDEDRLGVGELHGSSMRGEPLSLPGPWILDHRRSGALPKHVVDDEFGPTG